MATAGCGGGIGRTMTGAGTVAPGPPPPLLTGPCEWRGVGQVTDVRFSPDGKILAVAGAPFLKLFDAATGAHLPPAAWQRDNVSASGFSPDGKWVATISARGATLGGASVWRADDPRQGKILFEGHTVTRFAFSPDSALLALVVADPQFRVAVIRMSDMTTEASLPAPDALGALAMDFTADGAQLILLGGPSYAWTTATWTTVKAPMTLPGNSALPRVDQTTDYTPARALFVHVSDQTVSMGGRYTTAPETVTLKAVAVSRDGTLVAAGGDNGHVYLWQLTDAFLMQSADTLPLVRTFASRSKPITALAFSPDGGVLAVASGGATLDVWRIRDGVNIWRAEGSGVGLLGAAAGSGTILAFGGGSIGVLDAAIDSVRQTVPLPQTADETSISTACVARHDAAAVACASDRVDVVGVDGSSVVVGQSTAAAPQSRGAIALAPGGGALMESIETPEQPLRLFKEADLWEWPLASGATPRKVAHIDSQTKALTYSADGTLLAGVTFAGQPLRLWEVATGRTRGAWGAEVSISSTAGALAPAVALSDDGAWLAAPSLIMPPRLLLVALPTGDAREIALNEGAPNHDSVVFSPDGALVAASSTRPESNTDGLLNPGGIIIRTADGVAVHALPGAGPHMAFLSARVLLREENEGTISFWCVP